MNVQADAFLTIVIERNASRQTRVRIRKELLCSISHQSVGALLQGHRIHAETCEPPERPSPTCCPVRTPSTRRKIGCSKASRPESVVAYLGAEAHRRYLPHASGGSRAVPRATSNGRREPSKQVLECIHGAALRSWCYRRCTPAKKCGRDRRLLARHGRGLVNRVRPPVENLNTRRLVVTFRGRP
jgi:hypothetical protein